MQELLSLCPIFVRGRAIPRHKSDIALARLIEGWPYIYSSEGIVSKVQALYEGNRGLKAQKVLPLFMLRKCMCRVCTSFIDNDKHAASA